MELNTWLNDNQLAIDIFNRKYRLNNETLDEWLDRVSNKDKDMRECILQKKAVFAGRTLANRGTNNGSYSNCYSSGYVPDSLEGIMDTAKKLALTYKAQGGQGISLSKIRPKGSLIKGLYESDGIVPFMKLFNSVTDSISQGSSRRGALMMSLDATHPEIEEFISIKSTEGVINRANLSVEIDDYFMTAVELYYKTGEELSIQVAQDYNSKTVFHEIVPIKIYKKIIESAYRSAEPGTIFTGRFRNYNLMEHHTEYQIVTSNPCGEQPLPKNGSCNLMSVNLYAYVNNPFTEKAYFDVDRLYQDMFTYVRVMDEIIDENLMNHPLSEQREMARNYRNLGIGIMGLADTFIALGLRFGGKETIVLSEEIMSVMSYAGIAASAELAKIKGSFPKYEANLMDSKFFHTVFDSEFAWANKTMTEEILLTVAKYGIRNCSLLSVAPCGSISSLFTVSSGREPNFMLKYKRKTESLHKDQDVYYDVYAGILQDYLTCTKADPDNLPDYFVTAHDIPWKEVIDVHSVIQKYTDTAISATCNLPEETTVEEIEQIYLYAWQKGLKGFTIFREGSRPGILSATEPIATTKKRPERLPGKVVRFNHGDERWIAFIGLKDGRPYEIFTGKENLEDFPLPRSIKEGVIIKIKDSSGSRYDFEYEDTYGYHNRLGGLSRVFDEKYWNYAKLISALLRHEVELTKIIKIIDGLFLQSASLNNWKDGVKRALKLLIPDGADASMKCPNCGEKQVYQNSCPMCPSCGESKCG